MYVCKDCATMPQTADSLRSPCWLLANIFLRSTLQSANKTTYKLKAILKPLWLNGLRYYFIYVSVIY